MPCPQGLQVGVYAREKAAQERAKADYMQGPHLGLGERHARGGVPEGVEESVGGRGPELLLRRL